MCGQRLGKSRTFQNLFLGLYRVETKTARVDVEQSNQIVLNHYTFCDPRTCFDDCVVRNTLDLLTPCDTQKSLSSAFPKQTSSNMSWRRRKTSQQYDFILNNNESSVAINSFSKGKGAECHAKSLSLLIALTLLFNDFSRCYAIPRMSIDTVYNISLRKKLKSFFFLFSHLQRPE